jgi:hypothetical protein
VDTSGRPGAAKRGTRAVTASDCADARLMRGMLPGLIAPNVNASRLGNRTGLDSVVMTAGNQRSGRLRARCDVCDEEFNLGDDVIATVARDRDYRIRAIEVFLYHPDHWNPDEHRGEVKIIQGGFTTPGPAEED